MRVTHILFRQHIGEYFKKHWRIQGIRKPIDTGAHRSLKAKGIPIFKPDDILKEKKQYEKVNIIGLKPRPIKLDETHPDWHERVCLIYKDDNVLLEGLNQAKIITNTIELQNGLPENIILKSISKELDNRVKKIILSSNVFDAEQKKLPKIKDPSRPAFIFPRVYGITGNRVNMLTITKLLQLIELSSDPSITRKRSVLHNLDFSFPFEKFGDLIQFQLRGDTLITSSTPLSPITSESTNNIKLPDIFPTKHTITLDLANIYKLRNLYPINSNMQKMHPHTVFVHYNSTEVKNVYEEEVTVPQIFGRSLLKTFTVAATYAREQFGLDVKVLPKPVTVQCIQTDGRLFHFGILQLNTLNLEDGQEKNIWYQSNQVPLFSSCCYKAGRPTLEGYDNEAIKYLFGLYNNI